ncbi:MAG: hypothetical protein OYI31_08465 [Chloroflexota bacterium]|nr:hypothetical protein [Chloroflexota bacterium]MDE2941738.1 hypothetical protein [Chloroflexota bacterium]MDE3268463.1 hypothetical protein [Chloroflexota bacterium]
MRIVIENNTGLGYPSVGFRRATLDGSHSELLTVCQELIASHRAVSAMEDSVKAYRGFLTLEDYVMRWGHTWGFSPETVETAGASVEAFDRQSGFRRWVAEGEARDG